MQVHSNSHKVTRSVQIIVSEKQIHILVPARIWTKIYNNETKTGLKRVLSGSYKALEEGISVCTSKINMHIETLHYGKSSTVRNTALCAVCVSAKRARQQLCGGFYHKEQEWVYQKEKTWHVWNTSLEKKRSEKKNDALNTEESTLTCTVARWGIADSTVRLKRSRWRKTDDACFQLINKIYLALRCSRCIIL